MLLTTISGHVTWFFTGLQRKRVTGLPNGNAGCGGLSGVWDDCDIAGKYKRCTAPETPHARSLRSFSAAGPAGGIRHRLLNPYGTSRPLRYYYNLIKYLYI